MKSEAVDLCFAAKVSELVAEIGNSPNGRLNANINVSIMELAIVAKPVSYPPQRTTPPRRKETERADVRCHSGHGHS